MANAQPNIPVPVKQLRPLAPMAMSNDLVDDTVKLAKQLPRSTRSDTYYALGKNLANIKENKLYKKVTNSNGMLITSWKSFVQSKLAAENITTIRYADDLIAAAKTVDELMAEGVSESHTPITPFHARLLRRKFINKTRAEMAQYWRETIAKYNNNPEKVTSHDLGYKKSAYKQKEEPADVDMSDADEHGEQAAVQNEMVLNHPDTKVWFTPPHVMQLACSLLQPNGIDLDIASLAVAAEVFSTSEEENADTAGMKKYEEILQRPWFAGTVFLKVPPESPSDMIDPFSDTTQCQFAQKFFYEFHAGHFKEGVAVVRTALGQPWFLQLLSQAPHVLLTNQPEAPPKPPTKPPRQSSALNSLSGPERSAVAGILGLSGKDLPVVQTAANKMNFVVREVSYCVFYVGPNVNQFCAAFAPLGVIPGYNSWSHKATMIMS